MNINEIAILHHDKKKYIRVNMLLQLTISVGSAPCRLDICPFSQSTPHTPCIALSWGPFELWRLLVPEGQKSLVKSIFLTNAHERYIRDVSGKNHAHILLSMCLHLICGVVCGARKPLIFGSGHDKAGAGQQQCWSAYLGGCVPMTEPTRQGAGADVPAWRRCGRRAR